MVSNVKVGAREMFTPFSIGKVEIKNRLIMAPMETNMPSLNGEVNDRVIQYYGERAKGGVGAIIVEFTCVDAPIGKGTHAQLVIDNDGYIAGHTYLVEEIQKHQCKAFLQLHHAGRQTTRSIAKAQPVAPSPIACKVMKTLPRELTTEEIENIVMKFVKAARRAKLAGYDGVELHAAHGYLLGSFLSPYTNKRTDKYGGSTENRVLIIKEIIAGIRKLYDKSFPIIVRISAEEFVEGGLTLEESLMISKLLEEYGADAIHVSTGIFESNDKNIDPMSARQGWRIPYAHEIKKVVSIPVIGVGVIREPEFANSLIKENKVDFIALGRTLIADPEWPIKARKGKDFDINRCTTCGYCTERLRNHQSIRCSVNPRAGRETVLKEIKASVLHDKKVHVIGAGPVGLYAAYLAGKKGFDVSLYEEKRVLGGLFDVISAPPGKEKWHWFKEFLIHQINQLPNVNVKTNFKMTEKKLIEYLEIKDYVLDCTGMIPKDHHDLSKVKIPVYNVSELLDEPLSKVENKHILILGARGAGLEAAHYFSERGNKVIVVSRSGKESNGLNIDFINRIDLLKKLKQHSVKILNNTDISVDEAGAIRIIDLQTNQKMNLTFTPEIIVSARGFLANDGLGHHEHLIKIGGSDAPKKILDGVYKAYVVVSSLAEI